MTDPVEAIVREHPLLCYAVIFLCVVGLVRLEGFIWRRR